MKSVRTTILFIDTLGTSNPNDDADVDAVAVLSPLVYGKRNTFINGIFYSWFLLQQ